MGFALAAQMIAAPHPIVSIWRRNTRPDAPPPGSAPETALILRPGFDPEVHLVPAAATGPLTALMGGAPLGAALADAAASFDLPGLLQMLLAGQAITDLTTD